LGFFFPDDCNAGAVAASAALGWGGVATSVVADAAADSGTDVVVARAGGGVFVTTLSELTELPDASSAGAKGEGVLLMALGAGVATDACSAAVEGGVLLMALGAGVPTDACSAGAEGGGVLLMALGAGVATDACSAAVEGGVLLMALGAGVPTDACSAGAETGGVLLIALGAGVPTTTGGAFGVMGNVFAFFGKAAAGSDSQVLADDALGAANAVSSDSVGCITLRNAGVGGAVLTCENGVPAGCLRGVSGF